MQNNGSDNAAVQLKQLQKKSRQTVVCREGIVLTNPSLVEQISAKRAAFKNKSLPHV